MTSNNDEALNFYGYSSYEQQKHDALERVVHKKEIRTIKMEELRSEVEQLKEGQMMEIIFDGR